MTNENLTTCTRHLRFQFQNQIWDKLHFSYIKVASNPSDRKFNLYMAKLLYPCHQAHKHLTIFALTSPTSFEVMGQFLFFNLRSLKDKCAK